MLIIAQQEWTLWCSVNKGCADELQIKLILNLNMKFQVFIHLINVAENVANNAWNNSLDFLVHNYPLKILTMQQISRLGLILQQQNSCTYTLQKKINILQIIISSKTCWVLSDWVEFYWIWITKCSFNKMAAVSSTFAQQYRQLLLFKYSTQILTYIQK